MDLICPNYICTDEDSRAHRSKALQIENLGVFTKQINYQSYCHKSLLYSLGSYCILVSLNSSMNFSFNGFLIAPNCLEHEQFACNVITLHACRKFLPIYLTCYDFSSKTFLGGKVLCVLELRRQNLVIEN